MIAPSVMYPFAPPSFTDNDDWMIDDGDGAIVVDPDGPRPAAAALDAGRADRRRF